LAFFSTQTELVAPPQDEPSRLKGVFRIGAALGAADAQVQIAVMVNDLLEAAAD